MPRLDRFTAEVAFVTGTASGIGRAAAVAFATEDAKVAVLRPHGRCTFPNRRAIRADGGEVLALPCNVSNPQAVERAVARVVEAFDRIDCAFNNAGVENKAAPVHEIELAEWDRILGINLRGTFVCMRAEIGHVLRPRRAHHLNRR